MREDFNAKVLKTVRNGGFNETTPYFWILAKHRNRVVIMSIQITYVKCVDPESNRVYYYNKMTREAHWKLPQGVQDQAHSNMEERNDTTIRNYVTVWILH